MAEPTVMDSAAPVASSVTAAARGSRRRTRSLLLNVASLAVFVVFWQVLAKLIGSPFLPGPGEIVVAFVKLVQNGDTQGTTLLEHSWASLHRVMVGESATSMWVKSAGATLLDAEVASMTDHTGRPPQRGPVGLTT